MGLKVYQRGRYHWLQGTVAGTRVHESTGQTDPELANIVKTNREKELIDRKLYGPKAMWTFAQAVQHYLDSGGSERFLLPLLDHFETQRIIDMSGADIRAAAKKLYPGRVYTTWNRNVITPARAVINRSADDGKGPFIKIKGFSKRDRDVNVSTKPKKRAVDREYIDLFRDHCDNPWVRALVLFIYQTGARIGDVVRIEPEDMEPEHRRVLIRDMKNGEDGYAELTAEMLHELQDLEPRFGRVFGYTSKQGVYPVMKRVCKAAGIPYLGTHQPGRHSFATEMIVRSGIDPATTAKKGRWKTVRVLMEHYAHADEGDGVIEGVFGSGQERPVTKVATRPFTTRRRKSG